VPFRLKTSSASPNFFLLPLLRLLASVNRIHPGSALVSTSGVIKTLEWKLLLSVLSLSLQGSNASDLQCVVSGERKDKDKDGDKDKDKNPTDWNAVAGLADRHGVSSLLYQALAPLQKGMPAAGLDSLRRSYERNVHKSLLLARELLSILDSLNSLGIEALPYKGVVLSEVYYGDMAMRQSGDMDLFVNARDLGKIKDAVRDLGYTPRVAIPENAHAEYLASGYECSFDSAAGTNLLELQWALQPRFYAVDFDMEGLFARAQTVELAGRSIKTPSAEDLLIVLSVHAAKHVWGRLIWLCDIAQIAKNKDVNWDAVQSQARNLGIERILHITLLLVNRLLSFDLPFAVQHAAARDRDAQIIAETIAISIASGASCEEEKLSYFRLTMRLRERPLDRLRFLSRLTFTPAQGEWQAVRLPKPLFPLYRIVRLARLASRFARG
jgi:hypothetical protein